MEHSVMKSAANCLNYKGTSKVSSISLLHNSEHWKIP